MQSKSYVSFTPLVPANMRPVRSSGVCNGIFAASEYVTAVMMKALGAHRNSLRELRIYSRLELTANFANELLLFLAFSRVRELYIQAKIVDCDLERLKAAFPETLNSVMIGHSGCGPRLGKHSMFCYISKLTDWG